MVDVQRKVMISLKLAGNPYIQAIAKSVHSQVFEAEKVCYKTVLEWPDIDCKSNTIKIKRKFMHRKVEQLKTKHSQRMFDITSRIKETLRN